MQQNAQNLLLQTIEALIQESELDPAIEALLDLDKQAGAGIRTDILQVSGNYRMVAKEYNVKQTISFDEYKRAVAQARFALLDLMKTIPKRVKNNSQYRGLDTFEFKVPDDARLEKIIGDQNNLFRINWLEKALTASKAVCRVVCGRELGTGFITKDGYLYTNNHVIPNAAAAAETRIEFNYKMSATGEIEQRSLYKLDARDFISSPPNELDFVRVKVMDNPAEPLSKWGYADIDPSAIPIVGEGATIIQHPKGQDMQIALTSNDVLSVWKQYLFYETDTEPGSSGSPVFNKDWKVVALHHAGKTMAEGGLQINEAGQKAGANRGILFRDILTFINGGIAPTVNRSSGSGRESVEDTTVPETPIQPVATVETEPNPVKPPPVTVSGIPKFVVLYDLQDEPKATLINKHLTVLKLTKKIIVHNVHQVKGGEDVIAAADSAIATADYLMVLLSSNIFNDDAIWLAKTLEAMVAGKRIIPIRIDAADVEGTGLEKLRSLPSMNRTIADFPNPDAGYANIVEEIKRLIQP